MLKEITMCICDICGYQEPAKTESGHCNETAYILPNGWTYGHNRYVHMCPDCSKKLGRTEKFTR